MDRAMRTRVFAISLVFLMVGFGAGAFWFYHHSITRSRPAPSGEAQAGGGLSDATRAVLARLPGPVEIRYYALLDPKGAPDSLKAFAGRVDQLMAEYQQAAGDKLTLARKISQSDDSAAAAADGLKAFNMDKGDACFLGVVVSLNGQKAVLPELAPEWEQAVEPDLTRAIAGLIDAPRPGIAPVAAVKPQVMDEVKTAFPDLASVSVNEGTQRLRTAAVKEYQEAAKDFGRQITDAQRRLSEAQLSGTDAEEQAAMKNLQDIQSAQSTKLQAIAAQSQQLIEAFKELKKQSSGQ